MTVSPCLLVSVLTALVGVGSMQGPDPIHWSATRKLAWSDFKAKAPRQLDGARSALGYNSVFGCRDGKLEFHIVAVFVPEESWVTERIRTSGLASPVGLRHEQTHFDLKEVHARRIRKMFSELTSPCPRSDDDLYALAERLMRDEAATQDRFERETRAGENESKQIEWERRVRADLDALKAFVSRQ